MEIIWWLIVIASFIIGFAGLFFPVVPSVLMFWIGFLVYQFLINGETLSWMFWIIVFVLTVLVLFSDFIANSYFVKRYGGSKRGEYAAIIGVLIGMFIYPPIGIIVVPFVLVLIVELLNSKDVNQALRASVGSLLAFLSSAVFDAVVFTVMVVWFLLDALVF
ncbi:DUF456 domain-containing protein [Salinicoccus sp. ID82-1]|uniref:DUF456 domain-containing protein n=1 Tax=Salinicoccus cyprini TaxID=2493691 RepID=A0A558AR11_9STAP|nr:MULTISPECIES: DUF456 domain-containing protein [Salinicoccus]MCG1010245.1 DUF456 domain-containing protein [Salinicoccus sp. ID82-1]TVT26701.1 DUF456 domain-containing protein [Salinicoccus cyprini]